MHWFIDGRNHVKMALFMQDQAIQHQRVDGKSKKTKTCMADDLVPFFCRPLFCLISCNRKRSSGQKIGARITTIEESRCFF